MANVADTRTTYDDMLKYVYEDAIIQATREQSALLQKLETFTPKAHFGGKSITFPVLYNSQGSVGSADELDALPASLPGNFANAVIPISYHYFGCSVTGQVIRTSATPQDAFAQAWTLEVQIKTRAFKQMINRQLAGDGKAILAQVDGSVDGQVITIDNAGGWSGYNASHVNGAQFLSPNQYIQVRDSAGAAEDGGLKISGITRPGKFPDTSAQITVVGTASSVADGSYLYAAFSTTSENDAYGHEGPGLRLLIDDSTEASVVQSIDGSVNNEWNSVVKYGSNPGTAEAITALRLMEAIAEIQVGSDGRVDLIVTSPGVWLALGQLADESNQIMNAKTIELGYPSFEIMGIPVFQDPYCADEIYGIDKRSLGIYQTGPAGWLDSPAGSGNYISQVKGATAAYDQIEAYWYWYMSLGVKNRAWNFKIKDITVNGEFMLKV